MRSNWRLGPVFASWIVMYTTAIYDELRQIERDVAEGERRLAEQEALVVEIKRQNQESAKAEAELERMRGDQRTRDHDRQRSSRGCNLESGFGLGLAQGLHHARLPHACGSSPSPNAAVGRPDGRDRDAWRRCPRGPCGRRPKTTPARSPRPRKVRRRCRQGRPRKSCARLALRIARGSARRSSPPSAR